MKKVKGMLTVLVMVAICLAVVIPSVQAGYDYDAPIGPDAIEAIMPIPPETAKKFGKTEKVRLCYNIAELLKAVNTQRARIDALEKQVAELEETKEVAN